MIDAYLTHVATYVPDRVLTNNDVLAGKSDWTDEKVFAKLGFKERKVVAHNEYASDLAIKAVESLRLQTSLDHIDFILYCTQSPDYLIPSNAFLLHNHFGFSKSVGALDFNLGCSGYVYGLGMAQALIYSGQAQNILLVTSETYSKLLHEDDVSNRLIFGDGASASIISSELIGQNCLQVGRTKYGTDGTGWDKLKSGIGGVKRYFNPDAPDLFLNMDGPEVLLFTLREVPTLFRQIMVANEIKDFSGIQHVVFHQANKLVIEQIAKKMGLPINLIRNNMENFSNTVSATIPIVLEKILLNDSIKEQEKVALVGFGVGFSWAGTILTKV